MHNETLQYEADGLTMLSRFYCDESAKGPRPGVLVFPEAFGLGEHALQKAELLAHAGYAVLASDLHGNAAMISDFAVLMPLLAPMRTDPQHLRSRARAAMQALTARPEVDGTRIAAIGFCMGGTMALELARSGAAIRAAVGFHSGLQTPAPQDAKNIKAKVLVCLGADDPLIPPEQRLDFEKEMRAGSVDWQMKLYGGVVHSFTNKAADERGQPQSMRYDAAAEARSWAEMLALFDEVF
jgi:dienelactone hydrolase